MFTARTALVQVIHAAGFAFGVGSAVAQDPLTTRCESAPIAALFIRGVVITHGHFDHAGGAARLKEALPKARFAMTAEGWCEADESAARPDKWSMINPDMALTEQAGDPVTTHLTTHAFSNGLTESKELLKSRKPGEPHPLVDPKGFREQPTALQAGAEQRLVAERAKKAK